MSQKKVTEDLIDQEPQIGGGGDHHDDMIVLINGDGRATALSRQSNIPQDGAMVTYFFDSDDGEVGVTFFKDQITPAAIQSLYNVLRTKTEDYQPLTFFTEGPQYGYKGAILFESNQRQKAFNYLNELFKRRSVDSANLSKVKQIRMQQESRNR